MALPFAYADAKYMTEWTNPDGTKSKSPATFYSMKEAKTQSTPKLLSWECGMQEHVKWVNWEIDFEKNVPEEFIDSCMVFSNMFEDIGDKDSSDKIRITDSFEKQDVENYIELYNQLSSLKVTNNDKVEKSYLKYINIKKK